MKECVAQARHGTTTEEQPVLTTNKSATHFRHRWGMISALRKLADLRTIRHEVLIRPHNKDSRRHLDRMPADGKTPDKGRSLSTKATQDVWMLSLAILICHSEQQQQQSSLFFFFCCSDTAICWTRYHFILSYKKSMSRENDQGPQHMTFA